MAIFTRRGKLQIMFAFVLYYRDWLHDMSGANRARHASNVKQLRTLVLYSASLSQYTPRSLHIKVTGSPTCRARGDWLAAENSLPKMKSQYPELRLSIMKISLHNMTWEDYSPQANSQMWPSPAMEGSGSCIEQLYAQDHSSSRKPFEATLRCLVNVSSHSSWLFFQK